MIPLLVVLAVLLTLALLLLLRVRIVVTVREGVTLTARVLCLSFRLYPRKRRRVRWSKRAVARAARKKRRKKQKAAKKAARKARKRQDGHAVCKPAAKPTLRENLRLVRVLVATLIRRTGKHLTLHTARLHIRVAAEDAAKTAVLYGVISQSVAYLLALTERIARVRSGKNEVSVTADFIGERTTADIKLVFSMRLWGALTTALSLALAFLKEKRRQRLARRVAAQNKTESNGQAAPVGKE